MPSQRIMYKGQVYRLADTSNINVEQKIQEVIPIVKKYMQSAGIGTGEPEFDDYDAMAMADILVHAILHAELFNEGPYEHKGFIEWREQNYPKSKVGAGVYDVVMYMGMNAPGLLDKAVDVLKGPTKFDEESAAPDQISYKGAVYKQAVQGQELNPRQLADKIIIQAENTQKELNEKLAVAKQSLENAVSSEESETATERLSNILKEAESAYNQVWRLLYAMENFATTKTTNTEEKKEDEEE